MKRNSRRIFDFGILAACLTIVAVQAQQSTPEAMTTAVSGPQYDGQIEANSELMMEQGRKIFCTDTDRFHYDRHFDPALTDQQKNELIEYLRSL